jgi:hypothetical protein
MYIPLVNSLRADPISQAHTANPNLRRPSVVPVHTPALRDRFNLSDEARLREEYSLRLMQEIRRKRAAERSDTFPTLADLARLHAAVWDEIQLTFRHDALQLTMHHQALSAAWRDTLEFLARLKAEGLASREGDARASNVPLLREIIGRSHRAFADAFCITRPQSGTDRAILAACREAVKVLTLVTDQEVSLSDTMALLYYRKSLEQLR